MGISAQVINMATIKPLDEELVLQAAKTCGKVITCEEHSVIGGLGEAVCGLLSEKCPTPVRRIGVNDEFGHSGPAGALLKQQIRKTQKNGRAGRHACFFCSAQLASGSRAISPRTRH